MTTRRPLIRAASALLLAAASTTAQFTERPVPAAGGPTAGARYGYDVDLAGDLAVVGAPKWSSASGLPKIGQATLASYNGASWIPAELPRPAWLAAGDEFGTAVALNEDGSLVAVGAPRHDGAGTDRGAVVVYERLVPGGPLLQTVSFHGGVDGELSGSTLAASGDDLLVGAPDFNWVTGRVTVYHRSAPGFWSYVTTWNGQVSGDRFGQGLAISGDRAAVSAPLREVGGVPEMGQVMIYARSGGAWSVVQVLNGQGAHAWFGYGLDLWGDHLAAGSPAWGGGGAALVADWVNGQFHQKIAVYYSAAGGCGSSVAVSDERATFGIPAWVLLGFGQAGAFKQLYNVPGHPTPWTAAPTSTFTSPAPELGETYGGALALDGKRLLIGASWHDEGAVQWCGRAVVVELPDSVPVTDLGHGLAGTGAAAPRLAGYSAPCNQPQFFQVLTGARPGATAHLVLGLGQALLPFKGGVLVPDPQLLVTPLVVDYLGNVSLGSLLPTGLAPFSLVSQFWVQDPAGPQGYVASNGMLAQVPDFLP